MDPLFLSKALKYYKRKEVQEAMLKHAEEKEISPRYGQGFGKRPDTLEYPTDILEFAKRKATSFHCSEERWENPLQIQTGMSVKEANELRVGWDFVLDIDAKDWEISRLTAWLFVEALKAHNIHMSVKFSGNKGWHIGIPFEAFPERIVDAQGVDKKTKDLFPELPRAIATYLIQYIGDTTNNLVSLDEETVTFCNKIKTNIVELAKKVDKTPAELLERYCPTCKKTVAQEDEQHALLCSSCSFRSRRYTTEQKDAADDKELVCPKCKHIMEFHLVTKKACAHDQKQYQQRFKVDAVVEIDTVLLASRHLYRMAYSLHEKSGLASVVVDPNDVLTFKKASADPEIISFEKTFLDTTNVIPGEAASLCQQWAKTEKKEYTRKEFEVPDEAIPEEKFPPCMKNILAGLEDGKKRAMFALTNFLRVAGWNNEMIEARLYEWNKQNPEPLREVVIKGHMHSLKTKKDRFPPPNCMQFYREIRVCAPDDLCRTIKNPAQYVMKKRKMKK
ncbi:MAG: hypothetical protein OXR66_06675 [Candidatus Woesearchaeota archaeon]|nr:hypothetical protein [Candidatus Woesearchaeota archaeon]